MHMVILVKNENRILQMNYFKKKLSKEGKMKRIFFIASIFFTNISFATVINVPSDYPTIQLALNYSSTNDTILVQEGIYYENIIWPSENGIKMLSSGSVENTIIDGGNTSAVIDLPNNHIIDSTTVISGFTIQNGYNSNNDTDYGGGGINAGQANPKIENIYFYNNYGYRGGGLSITSSYLDTTRAVLRNLQFENNSGSYGTAIFASGKNNMILKNIYASHNGQLGNDVLYFVSCGNGSGDLQFENVKIINNPSNGIEINNCHGISFENITIADNQGSSSTGIILSACNDLELNNILITLNEPLIYGGAIGIDFQNSNSNIDVNNCTVTQMRGLSQYSYAIRTSDNSNISVNNSNICYNGEGFYSENSSIFMNAENNWWGHPSGPYHPTSNPDGQGDSVNIYVDVLPYLTEPDTIAPIPIIQNVSVDTFGIDYVDLYWDASPIGDLAGYKVYLYNTAIDVGLDTAYTLSGLTSGEEYSVMVTCYDNGGEESWFSTELFVSPTSISLITTEDTLDFGAIFVGDSTQTSLLVNNNGTADLNITNITSSTTEFEPEIDSLLVSPSSQGIIPIIFKPTEFGLVTANLSITSDAYNTPVLEVTLIGSGDFEPNPTMISVVDVPDDQGGQVRLSFTRSKYDGIDNTLNIESYTVWRFIDETGWDAVGMFNAVQDTVYHYVSPTLCDSTAEGICRSTFKVSAHTYDSDIFFWSDSMSGYSVDNISPEVPTGLLAQAMNGSIELSWDVSSDEDFQYFKLEKATDSGFTDYETIETIDTSYTDTDYEINITYYYRLSAVDYTGNVSGYSEIVESTVLLIDSNGIIPEVYALHQNYPNPFNPTSTIRYDLPKQSRVAIIIYDIMGRDVKRLVSQSQDVGFKSVVWDATNDLGQPVSAGIYLYRIRAGEFVHTKKMLLIK